MREPIAIDPWNCGCTECLTGEYVPLRRATGEQVAALLRGEIGNNTGTYNTFEVRVHYELSEGETLPGVLPTEVTVTCRDYSWTLQPHLLAL
jgi:hypothetical protein